MVLNDEILNIASLYSSPLEQTFGKTRMWFKYFQTFLSLTRSMAVDELLLTMRNCYEKTYSKRIVDFHKENCSPYFSEFNRNIASAFVNIFEIENTETIGNKEQIGDAFFNQLFAMSLIKKSIEERLTSNKVSLGCQNCSQSKAFWASKHDYHNSIGCDIKERIN
ncbi:hypothetical protein TRFO_26351 [Tritrichomonas foetus]|uniref:Uncharacterized protein n=1 Tax=Tritrichomonas foetus TaxID=1144522 RepID=A0A1J4K854_9EUKA|nr:hypothetical protein TRFO_26351 [Tritrichomonas foetus]|eukprot:OHT05838.1 hypothetical protein TRFO_26351 [Tritrichomonas foetus]